MAAFFHTAILSLIAGAAQFLPVSGSAHRILYPWMLQWGGLGPGFEAAALWGSLLALLAYLGPQRQRLLADKTLLRGLALASLPAALSAWLTYGRLDGFQKSEPIAFALIFFAILLFIADRRGRKARDASQLSPAEFLVIGCAQAMALIPGASLIGLSMTATLVLGLRRAEAGRLAFLLSTPLLMGLTLLKLKGVPAGSLGLQFWAALALSACAGTAAIRFLLRYLETKDIGIFCLYRVGLGLLALLLAAAQPPVHSARELKLPPPQRADPATLSPDAAKLRTHVLALARDLGKRSAVRPGQLELNRARDYVMAEFKRCGCKPEMETYTSQWMGAVKNGTTFHNVVAAIGDTSAGGVWVLGAHYDSAEGTPGADDNASGVAVILELACALKERPPKMPVRLVAYSTEEPPAYGTVNMGSAHDAKRLKSEGVKVAGMISLEMLGYYDSRPGSQIYFPFLKWFIPDRGDFLALVSNFKSRPFLKRVSRSWRRHSDFPLLPLALPEFEAIRPSDHQGYWDQGFRALMLTDSASYRNPHYHEPTDLPDTLDYEAMARVKRALANVLSSDD
ncbi:MAG: M28 family peptidase [Elusimicrobia bacterium]|nr:M28 family peptidase [Elusimicrobiota bacterium]